MGLINRSLYGRIGLRLTRNWLVNDDKSRPITTWSRINLWHGFYDSTDTTFASLGGENPVTFAGELGYSWAQISLGALSQFANGVALFASGDFSVNFAGGNGQVWAGRLGAKYAF